MTTHFSRRGFLAATAAATMGGLISPRPIFAATQTPTNLTIERRILEVLGKPASVFGIRQPNGEHGLALDPGQRFLLNVDNRAGEDAVIHWHGQTPPYLQDGVADANRPLIKSGTSARYDFTPRTGTHWMHSHHGLQEQLLMAAPLIVRAPEDLRDDAQEVTVLLHDFTFKDPAEVLAGLTGGAMAHGGHGMDHAAMGHGAPSPVSSSPPAALGMPMDLNDVDYDAYLANDRTLEDPQVVAVERGGRVRLRLINGATSTAFHIDLGRLEGTVIAADGNPVHPAPSGRLVGMAMGQRLDILIRLPAESGAFPILAQREGDLRRTGIILATPGASVGKIASQADADAVVGPVDLGLEKRLRAVTPMDAKPVDVSFTVALTGGMAPYVWSIDDAVFGRHRPLTVSKGRRVAITMVNRSAMAHPMHLHGHHFQVTALNGEPLAGAVRDTVLVPADGSVAIAFDADNPGRWPLHCHNLLHMATGMMTEVVYDDFV